MKVSCLKDVSDKRAFSIFHVEVTVVNKSYVLIRPGQSEE
jgi:hypothetical protein